MFESVDGRTHGRTHGHRPDGYTISSPCSAQVSLKFLDTNILSLSIDYTSILYQEIVEFNSNN